MPLPQPPLGLRLLIQPSCQEMLALARELGSTVVKIAPRVRRRSLKRVPYLVGKGSWSKSHVLANARTDLRTDAAESCLLFLRNKPCDMSLCYALPKRIGRGV